MLIINGNIKNPWSNKFAMVTREVAVEATATHPHKLAVMVIMIHLNRPLPTVVIVVLNHGVVLPPPPSQMYPIVPTHLHLNTLVIIVVISINLTTIIIIMNNIIGQDPTHRMNNIHPNIIHQHERIEQHPNHHTSSIPSSHPHARNQPNNNYSRKHLPAQDRSSRLGSVSASVSASASTSSFITCTLISQPSSPFFSLLIRDLFAQFLILLLLFSCLSLVFRLVISSRGIHTPPPPATNTTRDMI
jgi:hypothetical protein